MVMVLLFMSVSLRSKMNDLLVGKEDISGDFV